MKETDREIAIERDRDWYKTAREVTSMLLETADSENIHNHVYNFGCSSSVASFPLDQFDGLGDPDAGVSLQQLHNLSLTALRNHDGDSLGDLDALQQHLYHFLPAVILRGRGDHDLSDLDIDASLQ